MKGIWQYVTTIALAKAFAGSAIVYSVKEGMTRRKKGV
jgi:hypothetical protein